MLSNKRSMFRIPPFWLDDRERSSLNVYYKLKFFHTFHSSLNNNRKMVDHIFKYIWRNEDLVLLTTTTTMWNEDFQLIWSWIKEPLSLSFDRRGNTPFTKLDKRSMKRAIHPLKEIRYGATCQYFAIARIDFFVFVNIKLNLVGWKIC